MNAHARHARRDLAQLDAVLSRPPVCADCDAPTVDGTGYCRPHLVAARRASGARINAETFGPDAPEPPEPAHICATEDDA